MLLKFVKPMMVIAAAGLLLINLAIAVPKKFHEQGTHSAEDELALAREVAAVKEKLAEYKVAQSFFSATGDVAMVTVMGAMTGVLAGLGHMVLSKSLFDDYACLIPDDVDRNNILLLANAGRIAAFALQGSISGFWLGIAGQAGSMPQMSKTKMALVLALQNAIAAVLSVVADHIGMNELEPTYEANMTAEQKALGQAIGRRKLFGEAAKQLRNGEADLRMQMGGVPVVPTVVAQAIALFAVVPESFEVWSSRKSENKKMLALQDALKKLEQSMNCVEAEESLTK